MDCTFCFIVKVTQFFFFKDPLGRETSHKNKENQFIHWLATHIEDPQQIELTPSK
jgi:hypothetical protein